MKLNTIAMAAVISFSTITCANAANEGHGKITFLGSIIDAPCSIRAGDEDQSINLGAISNAALKNGGKSTPVPFYIHLENCSFEDSATKNKVTVTFTGTASQVNSALLGITGTAKGAGVAIIQQGSNSLIQLGKATVQQALVDGDDILSFMAYVQGEGEKTAVVEGAFQAITDFQLHYN